MPPKAQPKGYGHHPPKAASVPAPTKTWYSLKGIHDKPTIPHPHTSQPKEYYDNDVTHGKIPAPAVSDISDTKSWDDLLQKAIQQRDRHAHQYKDIQRKLYQLTPPNPNDNQYRPAQTTLKLCEQSKHDTKKTWTNGNDKVIYQLHKPLNTLMVTDRNSDNYEKEPIKTSK